MIKSNFTLAAVLCAACLTTTVGCRSGNVNDNDPAYDEDRIHKPLNGDENDPEPAPADPAPNNDDPELARLRAENNRLRQEAGVAPVDSSQPAPSEPQASSGGSAPAAGYTPSHGTLPVPENSAHTILYKDVEIRSPLLRSTAVWGNTQKPREDFYGSCFFNGKVPRTFHFNVPNGTTHRAGKVDVDELNFIDPPPVRPRVFEVKTKDEQGKEITVRTRRIPLAQPGHNNVVWNWYFCPLPRGVRETMNDPDPAQRISWRVWVTFTDGTYSEIGRLSFSQDTLSVPSGNGASVGSVANGRKPNGVMTHAYEMRP